MSEKNEERDGSGKRTGNLAVGISLVVVVGLIAGVVIPSFTKARNTSQQNACVGNLRIMDSGKEQVAMAYNLVAGDTIASTQINEYVKGNTTPICPAGGSYTYGRIGERPACSVDEPTLHVLP